ncbi:Thiol peroxidase, Bcp-type [hydrothermal vent metagenome]|uniref:thioredoxin-dependent peroxiredoxin n=1 Tax=hydrothermal vent metagenome TaxID=652676 RepID=A0A3B0ZJ24_9ZZZZ
MLIINQAAPDFAIPNQKTQTIKLADYKGKKHVVLYFYPKDDTPGCTIEANEFTALANDFEQVDTVILGVSKDDSDSHQAFIDKYNLKIELLADTIGDLCESYGVWQEKEKNGVKKMGIVRSTFLINKQGIIKEAIYGVTPQGHAQAMLEMIQKF